MDRREDDEQTALPGGCRLIYLPEIVDERGSLSFLQNKETVPFPIERVFWIWDVQPGKSRGGHAHRVCAEVVFPLKGSFMMHVDDGVTQAHVLMDNPTCGILIPAGVWCRLTDFEAGTVCLAVASHPYDATGYINNHEDYLKSLNEKR
ncbi:MAG: sugar 3,4-ketoisomerase [Bacteroidaceae bacterium]